MKKLIFTALILVFANADSMKMQVYKPVTSTCPKSWIDDMKKEIGNVEVVTLTHVRGLKRDIGIPTKLYSCNTSLLDDYVFEGNVPKEAIRKFLKEKPKNAIGLSLPTNETDKEIKTVYIMFEDKSYKEYGKYK